MGRFNDWFEHVGVGVVEVGVGLGIKDIKDSINDFNEAKSLFLKSREVSDD